MSAVKESVIDLRPNRVLLNPHFDSYKLSLDTFPFSELKFDFDSAECYKPDECFSFHHAKICSDFNGLVINSVNDGESTLAALFSTTGELVLVDVEGMITFRSVWKVPRVEGKQGLALSASFVREDLLLVENGVGNLFLLEVKREPELSTSLIWSGQLGEEILPNAVLLDNATMLESGEIDIFSLAAESCSDLPQWLRSKLSSSIRSKMAEESGFATSVYWHRLSKASSDDTLSWNISCLGRFVSSSTCSLAVRGDGGIILGGERPFINMMQPPSVETSHKDSHGEGHLYSWHQDKEFVVLTFPLQNVSTKKDDVLIEIKKDSLTVKVAGVDSGFELSGQLGGDIAVDGSTWVLDESPEFVNDPYVNHRCAKKLEISLAKAEHSATWVTCIVGDDRGHMLLNDEQLELVKDLTAPGSKHGRPSIYDDDDEVEDVNAKMCRNGDDSEHEAVLQWFDESGIVSAVVYIGSPQAFLFSRSHPYVDICLKNDVDGCVWRPKANKEVKDHNGGLTQRSFEHVATFDALAYVLASKENRRFTSCAPDFKLAAAADCRHHVYVYRRPEAAALINRKSGSHQTISRQHVIAVDPPEESIIGFQVTNSAILVLTPHRLVKYSLQLNA